MCSLSIEYTVGLTTKDRPKLLAKCLSAFASQTLLPHKIIIVNNNTNSVPIIIPKDITLDIEVIEKDLPIKGLCQGMQVILDWMLENNCEIGVKWDDDLIPKSDCMENLAYFIDKADAVGGCYPMPKTTHWQDGPFGKEKCPDKNKNHLQFFEWVFSNDVDLKTKAVEINALYSSYMFKVDSLDRIGGWRTIKRSPVGYREDTEITMQLGKCIINPAAIATHFWNSGGGGRSFGRDVLSAIHEYDNIMFYRRIEELDINFNSLFKVKEIEL